MLITSYCWQYTEGILVCLNLQVNYGVDTTTQSLLHRQDQPRDFTATSNMEVNTHIVMPMRNEVNHN